MWLQFRRAFPIMWMWNVSPYMEIISWTILSIKLKEVCFFFITLNTACHFVLYLFVIIWCLSPISYKRQSFCLILCCVHSTWRCAWIERTFNKCWLKKYWICEFTLIRAAISEPAFMLSTWNSKFRISHNTISILFRLYP